MDNGFQHYIYTNWPTYVFLYGGGIVLASVTMLVSAEQAWLGFIPLALAVLIVSVYFMLASLWAGFAQFGLRQHADHRVLFLLGQMRQSDKFVHIGLGRRRAAIGFSRRLTTGHLTAVDVYNPHLTPGRVLLRSRNLIPHPDPDPRITWIDSHIDLLPKANGSTHTVTMARVMTEFWQRGDQLRLLQEVYRILEPGGRLLFAEPTYSQFSLLTMGVGVIGLHPAGYWHELLQEAGFTLRKQQTIYGLVRYFRADKPMHGVARQLTFEFD